MLKIESKTVWVGFSVLVIGILFLLTANIVIGITWEEISKEVKEGNSYYYDVCYSWAREVDKNLGEEYSRLYEKCKNEFKRLGECEKDCSLPAHSCDDECEQRVYDGGEMCGSEKESCLKRGGKYEWCAQLSANCQTKVDEEAPKCRHGCLATLNMCNQNCRDSFGSFKEKDFKCIDSDSGKDYLVKGVVDLYDSSGNSITKEDKCKDETNLLEQYCEGNEAKEEEYDCNFKNMVCREGKCQENMRFETPVQVKLDINPPYEEIINPDTLFEVVLMAHPKIFSDKKIFDYMDEKFYESENWKIVSETDDLISVVNIVHPDPKRQVEAEFSLSTGQTKKGYCQRLEQVDDGQLWMCFAEFEPQVNRRGERISSDVNVKDDKDGKITTSSNSVAVANYEIHFAQVNGLASEDIMRDWGNIVKQTENFVSISGLEKTVPQQLANPKASYKFIYYFAYIGGSSEKFAFHITHIDETGKDKTEYFLKTTKLYEKVIGDLDIKHHPPNDKIIIVSNYLIRLLRTRISGLEGITDSKAYRFVVLGSDANFKVLSHELGHAYSPHFCDEYSVAAWMKQEYYDGSGKCKNKLPVKCLSDYINFLKGMVNESDLQVSFIKDNEIYCIAGTSIMGMPPFVRNSYPPGGECPIGEC